MSWKIIDSARKIHEGNNEEMIVAWQVMTSSNPFDFIEWYLKKHPGSDIGLIKEQWYLYREEDFTDSIELVEIKETWPC